MPPIGGSGPLRPQRYATLAGRWNSQLQEGAPAWDFPTSSSRVIPGSFQGSKAGTRCACHAPPPSLFHRLLASIHLVPGYLVNAHFLVEEHTQSHDDQWLCCAGLTS